MASSPTILDKIIAVKRAEIAAGKTVRPACELRATLCDLPPARDFLGALRGPGPIKLIAEIKKASPSKGIIRTDFQPARIARVYAEHGATCISVLTDVSFFQGGLDVLQKVRGVVDLPLLRKDFILDPYQILEARVAGADAVLLIAECLMGKQLADLRAATEDLGMTALVELYDDNNLARVLDCGARLTGVNNRDLRTFQTDLEHTIQLRRHIPADRTLVGESGIRSRQDVLRLQQAGVNAILVGEHLMAATDIGSAVDELLGQP